MNQAEQQEEIRLAVAQVRDFLEECAERLFDGRDSAAMELHVYIVEDKSHARDLTIKMERRMTLKGVHARKYWKGQ